MTSAGPIVELMHGSREQLDPKTGRLDLLTFERNVVNLAGTQANSAVDRPDASVASLFALLHPDPLLNASEQSKWLVEAHRRLTSPLTVVGFTLIGLFAVLGGAFRRHGGLVRPFLAVAIVTLLVAAGLGVNNFVAKHLQLLPLIWLTTLLPGFAAGLLLFMPRGLAPAWHRRHPAS